MSKSANQRLAGVLSSSAADGRSRVAACAELLVTRGPASPN